MSGGYPPTHGGQISNPYQNYPSQPGGTITQPQPPPPSLGGGGSGAYPRQPYPGPHQNQPMYPGPTQTWGAPPTNLPSSSGGYGAQGPPGQPTSVVHGGSGYNYQSHPPPTTLSGPPPTGAGSAVVGSPPTGSGLSHSQARISPAPPTSMAAMTTGMGQMQLGPQGTGIFYTSIT